MRGFVKDEIARVTKSFFVGSVGKITRSSRKKSRPRVPFRRTEIRESKQGRISETEFVIEIAFEIFDGFAVEAKSLRGVLFEFLGLRFANVNFEVTFSIWFCPLFFKRSLPKSYRGFTFKEFPFESLLFRNRPPKTQKRSVNWLCGTKILSK
jgi:hypothetical protein